MDEIEDKSLRFSISSHQSKEEEKTQERSLLLQKQKKKKQTISYSILCFRRKNLQK